MTDDAAALTGQVRHFTATGYVVHQRRVLLHWHPKVLALLPPGGHVDANEGPVQAVLREVCEETALSVEVLPSSTPLPLDYPSQVHPPETIMVEDIQDPVSGPHQHIDMIYFCRPLGNVETLNNGWYWVGEEELVRGTPVLAENGAALVPPEDVRLLGLAAIRRASSPGASS